MVGTNEVDFSYLKNKAIYLGDIGMRIIDLLVSSLELSHSTKPIKTADHFVRALVKYSSPETSGLQPEDFVWQFWESLIDIASQVPPRTLVQDVLFNIVILLEKIGEREKANTQMWKDLPDIDIAMRDNWNRSPTFDPNFNSGEEFTEPEWVNVNSFLARLHHKQGIWEKYVIWELREGLETPFTPIQDMPTVVETRIRVATEWIFESSRRIFVDSLDHAFSDYPEGPNTGRPYSCGPLYSGVSGYSLERWCFWKRRLAEIRTEVNEDLHSAIDKAIKAMTRAEKKLGKQLKSSAYLTDYLTDSEVESEIELEPEASSASSSDDSKSEDCVEDSKSEDYVEVGNTIDDGDMSNDTILEKGHAEESNHANCDDPFKYLGGPSTCINH
ncbi:hypothetical protein F5Y00DRAFT_226371 [Daldinia vernicosa]|uniref:uncharacterized protein n=1 Tax=Daldinia vernicosa TaxID=114800 RepID=UPI002008B08E|nr:uncharacterized protein F5Y00DRAFT_226371 [Daldinia vernicosa]KAI0852921.1 hypothetical protein F5Y00DRAFT_226371 [Daldinia vernicosa]